jgi:hypothetical protein
MSLRAYLSVLEDTFEVVFSYSETDVEGLNLIPVESSNTLQAHLEAISGQTGLSYKITDTNLIILFREREGTVPREVCGYIVDEVSDEMIEDAIILDGRNTYFSDSEGYFEIEAMASSVLYISRIGYEPKRFSIARILSANCPMLKLVPELSPLKAVEVTNYFAEGLDKRVNGEFNIDTESLNILPGMTEPDVLFTLQSLPGIFSRRETVSNLSIRGGTFDQNLLQYDGIRMFQSGHFFGLISSFNPYFLDNVTVTKNGTSPVLGDAVSGSIQMQSPTSLADDFAMEAGFNMISADVNMSIPISNEMSLYAGARRSLSNAVRTPVYRQYFNRAFRDTEVINNNTLNVLDSEELFSFQDYNLRLNWKPSSATKVSFSFIAMLNNLEHQESQEPNNIIESRTSTLSQSSVAGKAAIEHRIGDILLNFNSSISNYKLSGLNFDLNSDQILLQENEILDVRQTLTARWLISPRWDLFGGYTLDNISIANLEELNRPVFRRFIQEVQTSHTAFAELNFNSTNQKFQSSFGARYQYYQNLTLGLIEPRAVLNMHLTSHFTLSLAGELKNQASVQIIDLQNDFLGVEKRRWVLSDEEEIPVLQSQQASAGLTFQRNRLVFTAEVYTKAVAGILSSSQGFQNQFEFIRTIGDYSSNGLEVFFKKDFRKLSIWSSYTLSETRYDFPQLSVRDFPSNLDIQHVTTTGARLDLGSMSFSTSLNWNSGLAFTPLADDPVSGGRLNYAPPNSDDLPDFLRVDFSATYDFTLGDDTRVELLASAWNLFNRKNVIGTFYRLDNEETVNVIEERALGFTPNLSVRVTL